MHDGIDDCGAATAAMEMPRYVSHKKVWALEIDTIGPRENGDIVLTVRDKGYAPLTFPTTADIFARYKPVSGDFYVVYSDGYKSFSPRKAFLEGYSPEKP